MMTSSATRMPLHAAWLLLGFAFAGCPTPEVPAVCGGLQGLACESGEFCNFASDAQCGAADQTGTCEPIPELCTEQYQPVCGCDGQTYGNECIANLAGVSVASAGVCEEGPGGKACGGLLGLSCDSGSFCNYALDAMCGAADQTGICTEIPGACTKEYNPVCGCDGKTYGNACIANASGVSVSRIGECEKPGVSCDRRELRCKRKEDPCPEGQVHEIINGCYGACVPIDSCVCDEPADCSDNNQYTCHRYRGRCGPYVN